MHKCFATASQSPESLRLQSFVYYVTPVQFLDPCFWKGRVMYVLTMC